MKILETNTHIKYPELHKELNLYLCKSVISDINSRENIYSGEKNFLIGFGICNRNYQHDTIISRIVGSITPHCDNIPSRSKDVYMVILDVGRGNSYQDSQDLPLLYQNGKFLSLRKGDLIQFNQRQEHALFWDKRIDIATFWKVI